MSTHLWDPVDPNVYVSPFSAPMPPAADVFSQPGYHQPPRKRNGLAIAGLVLGIVSVILPLLAIGAIVCGHIALREPQGKQVARAAIAVGYTIAGSAILLILSIVVAAEF